LSLFHKKSLWPLSITMECKLITTLMRIRVRLGYLMIENTYTLIESLLWLWDTWVKSDLCLNVIYTRRFALPVSITSFFSQFYAYFFSLAWVIPRPFLSISRRIDKFCPDLICGVLMLSEISRETILFNQLCPLFTEKFVSIVWHSSLILIMDLFAIQCYRTPCQLPRLLSYILFWTYFLNFLVLQQHIILSFNHRMLSALSCIYLFAFQYCFEVSGFVVFHHTDDTLNCHDGFSIVFNTCHHVYQLRLIQIHS